VKSVKIENVCSLILKAIKDGEYDDVFIKRCVEVIAKKPKEVFETSDFLKLDLKTMIFIVQNSSLQIEEFELYESVLNWGKNQLKLRQNSNKKLNEVMPNELMKFIRYFSL
jgi:U3 small nucleolar ribonucleoprotein component